MKLLWLVFLGAVALAHAQEQSLPQLMNALGSIMSGSTNKAPASVVDFRELRALLPESAGKYKRTGASGEKNSAMGFAISQSEGQYADGKAQLTIKLTDFGGTGFAPMMSAAWTMSEIDRETETGYERTTKIGSYRGYEKFDHETRLGDIQLLVNNRFFVEVTVRDGKPEDLRAAVESINLDKLSALK